jgi:glycosyltransferase involved in cell wall biosynthesis
MVDYSQFEFLENRNYDNRNRWIHVGRIDPSKKIDDLITTFIRQLEEHPESKFLIVGQATPGNESYENALKAKYKSETESGRIVFMGKQSHNQIRELLNHSDLFIHCFQGSLDKSLVEATMSGITVITCNDAYLSEFGGLNRDLRFDLNALEILQKEIDCWRNLSSHELLLLARKRSSHALSRHSLKEWLGKLVVELNK